jgi:cobyrinic acid a,c-diamide synthase
MTVNTPRLVIAGLSGDAGKTIVSLSVIAGLRRKGLTVAPFKKGPDYIDPAWLGRTAQAICRNLDSYLIEQEKILNNFAQHSKTSDIALIEGNRGLYDGHSIDGESSTAALARLLKAPVVLVINCTKATRTIAALVIGCLEFEPETNIRAVILNNVAGPRHEKTIRGAIEKYCGIPVVGAIPKLSEDKNLIPGRHLGLVTPSEYDKNQTIDNTLNEIAEKYLDIEKIIKIAAEATTLDVEIKQHDSIITPRAKVGYFCDSVFTFYYPENLEALEQAGAEIVPISSTEDSELPEIDALYIGGGFPETQAERLTANKNMMSSVKKGAEKGMPIYAECGGLIYLSRSIKWNDRKYPMADLFPVDLEMSKKPIGHGYTMIEIDRANPFFKNGTVIKGHEFHYSYPAGDSKLKGCMKMKTGFGLDGVRDGLVFNNTLACYMHLHADSCHDWAVSIVEKASEFRAIRGGTIGNFNLTTLKEASAA